MAFDLYLRRGHPVFFGLFVVLSIIEGIIAAWLTARFNQHHNYLTISIRDRTRFLVFVSWWTVIFAFIYMMMFLRAPTATTPFASVGSHGIFLFVTWVFWLAGAASITSALGGGLNCSSIFNYPYCNQLNALEAFAWIIWIVMTIALLVVIWRGITSSRRGGDGLKGPLVTA